MKTDEEEERKRCEVVCNELFSSRDMKNRRQNEGRGKTSAIKVCSILVLKNIQRKKSL